MVGAVLFNDKGVIMRKAVKLGDIGTDHDGYPPTKVIAGSSDVFIDGKPAARVGDPLEPHDKPNNPKHNRAVATGSSTVFINGKPAALTGGKVDCGGVTIGTGTVNIDDQASSGSTVVIKPMLYDRVVKLDEAVSCKIKAADGSVVASGAGDELQTEKLKDFQRALVVWEEF